MVSGYVESHINSFLIAKDTGVLVDAFPMIYRINLICLCILDMGQYARSRACRWWGMVGGNVEPQIHSFLFATGTGASANSFPTLYRVNLIYLCIVNTGLYAQSRACRW